MSYNFDAVVDRRNSNSEKWNKALIEKLCGNREALPFWVADMDLIPCKEVHEAMKREAERGVIGYGAFDSLLPSFISFVKERHSWTLDSTLTLYAQGMLHALALALDTFTNEGDKVLLPLPAYHPFMDLCTLAKREIIPYHLEYSDGAFSFNVEKFKEASKECALILFCSPHNPSGVVFDKETLQAILKVVKEREQIILSDEIHADLTHPSFTHTPLGKANEGIGAKCITFMAPSKTFNIAGEHCAFAIFSSLEMKKHFEERQKALFLSFPGYHAGTMATAAYKYGLSYNKELTKYLEDNASFIEEYLKKNIPSLKFSNGGASFVSFIDCSRIYEKVKEDAKKHKELYKGEHALLSHFFGIRGGICMNDGSWFGSDYSKFVRFNYGTSREMVKEGLDRINKAIKALQ